MFADRPRMSRDFYAGCNVIFVQLGVRSRALLSHRGSEGKKGVHRKCHSLGDGESKLTLIFPCHFDKQLGSGGSSKPHSGIFGAVHK